MKATFPIVFTILLINSVAFSKAAKFPFQMRNLDCAFCTDYMLEDCICEDVKFCQSQSCYVPDKCADRQCPTEEEKPTEVQEPEIVPASANNLGNELDCDFCTDYMLEDCIFEDVEFCRSQSCYVPDKCADRQYGQTESPTEEEKPTEVQEPEIVPAAANTLGNEKDCDFCTDYMLEDCICEDVEFCRSQSCYVPDKCADIQCPPE